MMALRSAAFRDAVKDRTPLLDALEGEDTVAREFAGEALAVLGVTGEDDVRRVTELLARPEADLRRYAVRILLARREAGPAPRPGPGGVPVRPRRGGPARRLPPAACRRSRPSTRSSPSRTAATTCASRRPSPSAGPSRRPKAWRT